MIVAENTTVVLDGHYLPALYDIQDPPTWSPQVVWWAEKIFAVPLENGWVAHVAHGGYTGWVVTPFTHAQAREWFATFGTVELEWPDIASEQFVALSGGKMKAPSEFVTEWQCLEQIRKMADWTSPK